MVHKKINKNIVGALLFLAVMVVTTGTLLHLGILQEAFGGYDDYATVESFDSIVSGQCSVHETYIDSSIFIGGVQVTTSQCSITCNSREFYIDQLYTAFITYPYGTIEGTSCPFRQTSSSSRDITYSKTYDEVIRTTMGLSNGKLSFSQKEINGYGTMSHFRVPVGKTSNDYKIKFDYFISSGMTGSVVTYNNVGVSINNFNIFTDSVTSPVYNQAVTDTGSVILEVVKSKLDPKKVNILANGQLASYNKPTCLSTPPNNLDGTPATPTTKDVNGCQLWSYITKSIDFVLYNGRICNDGSGTDHCGQTAEWCTASRDISCTGVIGTICYGTPGNVGNHPGSSYPAYAECQFKATIVTATYGGAESYTTTNEFDFDRLPDTSLTFTGSIFSIDYIKQRTPLSCEFSAGQFLAMESFAGSRSISLYSTRYPVQKLCLAHPGIITKSGGGSTATAEIYQQLAQGEVLNIPSDETWTLFYIINSDPSIPTMCTVDQALNTATNTCGATSGVLQICSQGNFDPTSGLCLVRPQTANVCDIGRYNTQTGYCEYNPPVQALCLPVLLPDGTLKIPTYNSETQQCEWTPDTTQNCGVDYIYNAQSLVCEREPLKVIKCSSDETYNPLTDLCESYPQSQVECDGSWNNETKICTKQVTPNVIIHCFPGEVYSSTKDICEKTLPTTFTCVDGTYNTKTGECVKTIVTVTTQEQQSNITPTELSTTQQVQKVLANASTSDKILTSLGIITLFSGMVWLIRKVLLVKK